MFGEALSAVACLSVGHNDGNKRRNIRFKITNTRTCDVPISKVFLRKAWQSFVLSFGSTKQKCPTKLAYLPTEPNVRGEIQLGVRTLVAVAVLNELLRNH